MGNCAADPVLKTSPRLLKSWIPNAPHRFACADVVAGGMLPLTRGADVKGGSIPEGMLAGSVDVGSISGIEAPPFML